MDKTKVNKQDVIIVRVNSDMKKQVSNLAKKSKKKPSEYARRLFEDAIKENKVF
jgi:predicted transcriptional regulator